MTPPSPSAAPAVSLSHGGSVPQLGLGTWPLTDQTVQPAILSAFDAGYRHIDTAVRYGNENGVGKAIATSGLDRSEVFVTTKLDGAYQGGDRAAGGLTRSLERLGLGYVDLLLIHWPLPSRDQFITTWQTFEKLLAAGKARAIGVSNFKPAHLDLLLAAASIVPAVNQVQLSPFTPRHAERKYGLAHGIVTESYSPLGRGSALLTAAPIVQIADRHGRTPAQIVLRWHVQQGLVPIPKSADPIRIRQNIEIFDFELDDDDLAGISTLDLGPSAGVDSDHEGH